MKTVAQGMLGGSWLIVGALLGARLKVSLTPFGDDVNVILCATIVGLVGLAIGLSSAGMISERIAGRAEMRGKQHAPPSS